MNWNALAREIIGQGPVFWGAAAAIAAGSTLLVVSIVLQLRRVRTWSAGRVAWRRVRSRRPAPVARPAAGVAEAAAAGYAAQARTVAPETVRDDQTTETLALLLERLRQASARLATMSPSAEHDEVSRATGLKEPAQDVEYVFKAGV